MFVLTKPTTTKAFFILFVIAIITIGLTQTTQEKALGVADIDALDRRAPATFTGDNVYIAWWSNKTGNDEVMFRASTDNGATFGEQVNLSNTTNTQSVDVMIDALDNNVVVTWWERNNTNNEPVARISNDAGETFGPLLILSQNGTIENEAGRIG